ncbi:hypothetical protein KIPB_013085, partial [Kipferlia bialata]
SVSRELGHDDSNELRPMHVGMDCSSRQTFGCVDGLPTPVHQCTSVSASQKWRGDTVVVNVCSLVHVLTEVTITWICRVVCRDWSETRASVSSSRVILAVGSSQECNTESGFLTWTCT